LDEGFQVPVMGEFFVESVILASAAVSATTASLLSPSKQRGTIRSQKRGTVYGSSCCHHQLPTYLLRADIRKANVSILSHLQATDGGREGVPMLEQSLACHHYWGGASARAHVFRTSASRPIGKMSRRLRCQFACFWPSTGALHHGGAM
jgi:hypothetical protein